MSASHATHASYPRLRMGSAAAGTGERQAQLRLLRRLGLAVFVVQLIALLVWSGFEAARDVQGSDFVGFYQSWYLIAHGVLNPHGWLQSQGIFIEWPLAILALIAPHQITLLFIQDFAIVGAELVAYLWICDLIAARESIPTRAYTLTGLALLALDPWIYWSASWDYHSESLGTLFAVLAARDLFRDRRRTGALWCFVTLLCGMVPATYLVGIGVSLLFRRRDRVTAAIVAGAGIVWFALLTALGAGTTLGYTTTTQDASGRTSHLTAAAGLTHRISTTFTAVAHHWVDLFANLAPSGFIGTFTAPVVGIAGVALGENFSQGNPNSLVPSFQGLPLYVFVPVGTVIALIWVQRRFGATVAKVLAALLVVNVVGWAAVWLPKTVPTWLRVNSTQAAAIDHVKALIPQKDGVVVSQGISGAFANHPFVRFFFSTPTHIAVESPYTWFVVAPYAGVETATVDQSATLIDALAHNPNAKLEYSNDGIWAFRLRVPAGTRDKHLVVGATAPRLSAAFFATQGRTVLNGRVNSWYVAGTQRANGPIFWGDYFLATIGDYRARVKLTGSGPVTVEVWNDTTGRLLKRVRTTVAGTTVLTIPARVTPYDPARSAVPDNGAGPFQIDPVSAFRGNTLELKVYSTSAALIKVRWVSLEPAPASAGAP